MVRSETECMAADDGDGVFLVVTASGAKPRREGGLELFWRVFIEEQSCNVSTR